ISLLAVVAGLIIVSLPVIARSKAFAISIPPLDLLILLALATVLALLHEGIHGIAMAVFGARPRFGAVMVGAAIPAIYTTAPGHLFTRWQYLLVAVAPGLLISVLGFAMCFTGAGAYLVLPLALHLGGCTGDAAASLQVLRARPGTMCEDLRDGIRFHRAPTSAAAGC